jgi:hypothetical protein
MFQICLIADALLLGDLSAVLSTVTLVKVEASAKEGLSTVALAKVEKQEAGA